jgi:hypothetical protein
MDSTPGGLGHRLHRWFFMSAPLRDARARLPPPDETARRAFEQARLLRGVTREVAGAMEELRGGRRAAVLLSLYRDLVYWTLAAAPAAQEEAAPDLQALWARTPREKLLRAAGSADDLAAVRATLVNPSMPASLDASETDVERVELFAASLYEDLEAPRRRVYRILIQRGLHWAAAAAVVVAIALGVRAVALGPNLIAGKPFRVSSTLAGCSGDDSCSSLMFHSTLENNPWVEFDLGATKPVHRIEVSNRADCCQDRAVPLLVEISVDHVHWTEVTRRNEDFSTWTGTFPRTPARYVRLHVPRSTMFHLKDLAVR